MQHDIHAELPPHTEVVPAPMYKVLIAAPALRKGDTANAEPGEPIRNLVAEGYNAYSTRTISRRACSAALLLELPVPRDVVSAHLRASTLRAFPGLGSLGGMDETGSDGLLSDLQDWDAPSLLRARPEGSLGADVFRLQGDAVPGWLTAQLPDLTAKALTHLLSDQP